ncbi:MAG: DUF4202 domain-containing protein [Myxococcales bacterium]|nr:DUF4202 domain-containing protein [Myxococcales bacterium]
MTSDRFIRAVRELDRQNSGDPSRVLVGGKPIPRELAKADWLSGWISRLEPAPSEALRLTARCQHLRRFELKRSEFPDGRAGYHAWRKHMAAFHADEAAKVLSSAGYDDETISEVRRIVQKQGLGAHADVQTMEDALCLSFIEHDLADFGSGQSEEKLLGILRETWRKMSPRGRELAGTLAEELPDEVRALLKRALAPSE